jgi:hypothetical protein
MFIRTSVFKRIIFSTPCGWTNHAILFIRTCTPSMTWRTLLDIRAKAIQTNQKMTALQAENGFLCLNP